jgi:hypothetical protein
VATTKPGPSHPPDFGVKTHNCLETGVGHAGLLFKGVAIHLCGDDLVVTFFENLNSIPPMSSSVATTDFQPDSHSVSKRYVVH